MLAGSASINPVLFLGEFLLLIAWKRAGAVGLDRWLLPAVATPWPELRVLSQARLVGAVGREAACGLSAGAQASVPKLGAPAITRRLTE